MDYIIMNRTNAIQYFSQPHQNTALVISINASSEEPASLMPDQNNQVKAVLHVQFDDVCKDQPNAMTELHAAHIAKFMSEYTADSIIVHCGAGQSRSAGVCAAIMKAQTGSDEQVFKNPRYTPNMHCYRLTLEAMVELSQKGA